MAERVGSGTTQGQRNIGSLYSNAPSRPNLAAPGALNLGTLRSRRMDSSNAGTRFEFTQCRRALPVAATAETPILASTAQLENRAPACVPWRSSAGVLEQELPRHRNEAPLLRWVAHESAVGGVLQPQHAALPNATLELADVHFDDAAFFRSRACHAGPIDNTVAAHASTRRRHQGHAEPSRHHRQSFAGVPLFIGRVKRTGNLRDRIR